MAEIPDNVIHGKAFACSSDHEHQPGMTVRQYYKGQAVTGELRSSWVSDDPREIAKWAGKIADELIKEDQVHGI